MRDIWYEWKRVPDIFLSGPAAVVRTDLQGIYRSDEKERIK
ncbi:MAG: hypothetical protein ACOC5U_00490 [Candidatus Aminicenantaceae bacterium]